MGSVKKLEINRPRPMATANGTMTTPVPTHPPQRICPRARYTSKLVLPYLRTSLKIPVIPKGLRK